MSALAAQAQSNGFKVWGIDDVVYGPVELPTLVSWVKDERITGETWVYNEARDFWRKAKEMTELQMFFNQNDTVFQPAKPARSALNAQEVDLPALRKMRVFAGMNDSQIKRFVDFMELRTARSFTEIVKQGEPGDAMYLILDGEVRVRLMISGKETTLATLYTGDFFGEIALFDHGPRSADIVANKDTLLLKIGASSFQRLATEAPDLASPFLLSIGRTLTGRIRADNKRLRESVAMARAQSN
ncbi:MAG TPA: cyclic nucleotide-binding domain-containing protein [Methylomirabilota bacterium]|nr:cyclic nucleotide-binding domain-containing protein [Methylomirabilota bacterium]